MSPCFWAVNGALSVWAAVLATALALAWGIAASYWTGVFAYAAAALLLRRGIPRVSA